MTIQIRTSDGSAYSLSHEGVDEDAAWNELLTKPPEAGWIKVVTEQGQEWNVRSRDIVAVRRVE